jgi:cytochrome c oxidase subunit 2
MKLMLSLIIALLVLTATLALPQTPAEVVAQGKGIYESNCADCHRSNGEGLPVKFPALKGNPFVTGDPQPVVVLIMNGRVGKLGRMPAWRNHLSDDQIARVVSYVRNAWGNQASLVTPEMAAAARK